MRSHKVLATGNSLIGLASAGKSLLVTDQADGVFLFDVESQERLRTWAHTSARQAIACGASYNAGNGEVAVALSNKDGSGPHEIAFLPVKGPERSLAEASTSARCKTASRPVGLYPLEGLSGAVAVLEDGSAVHVAGDRSAATAAPRGATAPHAARSAVSVHGACSSSVVVVSRSKDGQLAASVYGVSAGQNDAPASLRVAAEFAVSPPPSAPSSVPLAAAVFASAAALLWSDGTLVALDLEDGSSLISRQLGCFDLSSAAAAPATPAPASAGKRKGRDTPAAAAAAGNRNGRGSISMAAMSSDYILVAGPASQLPGSDLCPAGRALAVVLDTRFGLVHAAASLMDEDEAGTSLGSTAGSCSATVALPRGVAVAVGASLRVATPRLGPLSLATVVTLRSGPAASLAAKVLTPLALETVLGGAGSIVEERPVWTAIAPGDADSPFLRPVARPWDEEAAARARRGLEAAALRVRAAVSDEASYVAAVKALVEAHRAEMRPVGHGVAVEVMGTAVAKAYWNALSLFVRGASDVAGTAPVRGPKKGPAAQHLAAAAAAARLPWPRGVAAPLAAAGRLPLLQLLLSRCAPPEPSDIAALTAALLSDTSDASVPVEALEEYRSLGRAGAAALVEGAEGAAASGTLVPGQVAAAACAAAAASGFTPREAALHLLVASRCDTAAAAAALQALPARSALRLLKYCAKWADKYSGPLFLRRAVLAAAHPPEGPPHVPTLDQVAMWASVALDVHCASLALRPGAAPAVEALAKAVRAALGAASPVAPLKGCLEHMLSGAPLPPPAGTVVANYRVELLDLGVGGR